MSDGTQTLTMAEALAEARTEMSPASDVDTEAAVPVADVEVPDLDEQAVAVEAEQPTADDDGFSVDASGLEDALLDANVDTQNGSGSGLQPGSDEFWNHQVEVQTVNGPETVSVRELTDGYLRQADYTRKTQSIADQSKHLNTATEFYAEFEKDPAAFIRSLAVQAGYIGEDQAPSKEVIAKIPTQEELEAQVNELVEVRIKDDPRVVAAEMTDARNQVNTEFDRLEKAYNVGLNEQLRDSLIVEANQRGTSDLESLLTKRILMAQNKQSQAASGNLGTTSRPGSPPVSATQPNDAQVGGDTPSMREAWQQSKVAAAQQ